MSAESKTVNRNETEESKCKVLAGLWLQIFLAFSVSLSNMSDGMATGWTAAIVGKMTQDSSNSTAKISLQEASLIGTLPVYASLIMVFFSTSASNHFGRKRTILLGGLFMFFQWVLVAICTDIRIIYLAVVFRGFGSYIIYMVSAIYIAEIAQASIRGFLGNFVAILMNCGMLLSYICAAYMSLQALAILSAGIAGLMLALFIWAPLSPYFLFMKNKPEKARESLAKLRGSKPIERELQEIKETVEKSSEETASLWELFRDKGNRRILTIVLMVQAIQQLSGIDAILLFLQVILGTTDGNISTVSFGAMKLLSCTLALMTIDKIGRRPLLIFSTLTSSLALAILGTYFYAKEVLYHDVSHVSWVPLALLLTYVLCYNVGLGSVNFILGSEMFPPRFKALGNASVQITYCVTMLAVTQAFALLKDSYGFYLAFWIFSFITFLGFLYICMFVVETRGKTLHHIQLEFDTIKLNT